MRQHTIKIHIYINNTRLNIGEYDSGLVNHASLKSVGIHVETCTIHNKKATSKKLTNAKTHTGTGHRVLYMPLNGNGTSHRYKISNNEPKIPIIHTVKTMQ